MNIRKTLSLVLFLLSIFACDKSPSGYEYNDPQLSETPVNMLEYNTEYDDYNSTSPSLGMVMPFCFSTNRYNSDGQFDIIYKPLSVHFSKISGELTVSLGYDIYSNSLSRYYIIQNQIHNINTSANEFGPYLLNESYNFTILYASNVSGNFQINYASTYNDANFTDINEVSYLNSNYDDLYPCFNADRSKLYFCSNRENNNFDIYFAGIENSGAMLNQILSDSSEHGIAHETVLASEADDKCPFIYEDVMIFTSNRPGGYGGFDLYYSVLENGNWSTPINFGPKINSAFDEYRPILIDPGLSEFNDDNKQLMMVFSSNRTGGKGGFDLYYVGVANF